MSLEADRPEPGAGTVDQPPAADPATFPVASRPPPPPPPLVGARQLVGASLDLLVHAGESMRWASFYIGIVVLVTAGPLALAVLGIAANQGFVLLLGLDLTGPPYGFWLALMMVIALAGLLVATIESQAMAIAVLGGQLVGRPVTTRQAVQRSRTVFWSLVVASLVIGIPVAAAQQAIAGAMAGAEQAGLVVGLVVGVLIQAPFVYAACGIVLGAVGPFEAIRRSVRVFRSRVGAGLVVAVLPTLFQFILAFGLEVGLDVIVRVATALGLRPDAGPVGLGVLTAIVEMGVFALGTLVYTAAALIAAPQVVMFVGLTHATIGLDEVRPGGPDATERWGAGHRPFRWFSRPLLAAFLVGGVALAAFLATLNAQA